MVAVLCVLALPCYHYTNSTLLITNTPKKGGGNFMSRKNKPQSVSMGNSGSTFMVFIVTLILVAVVAVGFIVFKQRDETVSWSSEEITTVSNIQATLTKSKDEGAFITFYTKEDAPDTVTVFSDPRCSVCKTFEDTSGAGLANLVSEGKIKMRASLLSFLDINSKSTYSKDAITTLATLVENGDAETAWKFYNTMWSNQPSMKLSAKEIPSLEDMANTTGTLGASSDLVEKIKKADPEKVGGEINSINMDVLEKVMGQVATPTVFFNETYQENALDPNWVDTITK